MQAPVLVYPNSLDATPSDPEPRFLASAGEYWCDGQRVTWRHSTEAHHAECAYCQDGRCEQRVESCADWERDVVIHDRPRVVQ
jgi:hypothetical protein